MQMKWVLRKEEERERERWEEYTKKTEGKRKSTMKPISVQAAGRETEKQIIESDNFCRLI